MSVNGERKGVGKTEETTEGSDGNVTVTTISSQGSAGESIGFSKSQTVTIPIKNLVLLTKEIHAWPVHLNAYNKVYSMPNHCIDVSHDNLLLLLIL